MLIVNDHYLVYYKEVVGIQVVDLREVKTMSIPIEIGEDGEAVTSVTEAEQIEYFIGFIQSNMVE